MMKKPYGKRPKTTKEAAPPRPPEGAAFKIKLRGKDNAPLSMTELQQGLYELAQRLAPYPDYRARWVTVYLTLVDQDGREVRISESGEWTLYPYRSAADDHGA